MAGFMRLAILLGVLVSLGSLTSSVSPNNQNQDLLGATVEMQRANYFTFVTLINMASLDRRFQGNVTFLMPNDRMLSRAGMPQGSVSDFLLRHSIPSPLLFDYLEHIPTGSIIPSSLPNYMLRISNNGRRNFSINNVKLISPNICTEGSSIRCHGIDGVLLPMIPENNTTYPSCSSRPSPAAVTTNPVPPPPTEGGQLNPTPARAPTTSQTNSSPPKSEPSPWGSYWGTFKVLVTTFMMVFIVGSA